MPNGFGTGDDAVIRYIEHLVHQDVLAKDESTPTYRCPIPSFQSFLIEQANFTQEEEQFIAEKLNSSVANKSQNQPLERMDEHSF